MSWTSALQNLRAVTRPRTLLFAIVTVLIAYLAAVPLVYLARGTFFGTRGFTFDSFVRAFGDPQAATLVLNSLVYALGSMALALVIGTLLAYVAVRTDVGFRGLLFAMSLVPIILPAILYAPAWILLASPNIGFISKPVNSALGFPLIDIYTMSGMIWVEGMHLSPLCFLMMVAAFRSLDPSLEESARVSGVRPSIVFWRLTVPLARPALAASGVLILVLGLESFEVPALIGMRANIFVFTSRIYFLFQQYPADFGAAGAIGVALLLVAGAAALSGRIGRSREATSYQTITGRAFRPRPVELGRARALIEGAVVLYFLVAVVLPVAVLVYNSLLPYFQSPSLKAVETLTLANYRAMIQGTPLLRDVVNTVVLAVGGATATMMLTVVAAWLVVRSRTRGRILLDGLAFTPLIIPGLVLGVALLFVYLRFPLPIYGTMWVLLIAYTTKSLPFGMRFMNVSMHQVGNELEESAQVCGATWWQTFRRVMLPLTSAGIASGWIYIVMLGFRELSSIILLYGPGTETLSVLIFHQFLRGSLGILCAIGVLMILTLVFLVVITYTVASRVGVRASYAAEVDMRRRS